MTGWSVTCRDLIGSSPFPTVALKDEDFTVLHANPAFRELADRPTDSLEGLPISECVPKCAGCTKLVSAVSASGITNQIVVTGPHESWNYSAWIFAPDAESPRVIMLQITEATEHQQRLGALNESLLLSAVAQHESAEIARATAASMSAALASRDVELDRTKEELRLLTMKLLKSQDDERRRIGRELHDSISQQLALVGMKLFRLDSSVLTVGGHATLADITKQIDAIATEVRALSHELHSAALEDLGIQVALHGLLEEFEIAHGIPTHLRVTGPLPAVTPLVGTTLFRIVQEALLNVVKHAGHDVQVTVLLSGEHGNLLLRVEDTGVGFDASIVQGMGGLGMISMQERALSVNATFAINSAPGKGTVVQLIVPLRNAGSSRDLNP